MLKKQKQLITGFLLGALLFSMVPVGATIQDYLLKKSEVKIMVDGKEFSNKELPVLIHEGYNYIPAATFREICDTIGVEFEYVGNKREIQIDTKKTENLQTIEEGKGDEMGSTAIDNYNTVEKNGIKYVNISEIYVFNKRYDIRSEDMSGEKGILIHYTDDSLNPKHYETLLTDIPITKFEDITTHPKHFIEYQYFLENIIPLVTG